jgi:hypothetical protein
MEPMKKLLIPVAVAAFVPLITLSHVPVARAGAHDCIATGHCDAPYTGNNGQGAVAGCYNAGGPGHPEYYIGPDPCTGVPYQY